MIATYSNGYGVKQRPPECQELGTVDCPCCEGAAEHLYGEGMDADGSECHACKGNGTVWLVPEKPAEN